MGVYYRHRKQTKTRKATTMKIATIRIPAHWTTADSKDIEREMVGLIIEKQGLAYNAIVNVHQIKNPLLYGSKWTPARSSRLVREAGKLIAVRWS